VEKDHNWSHGNALKIWGSRDLEILREIWDDKGSLYFVIM
jgi:hypothetical protein